MQTAGKIIDQLTTAYPDLSPRLQQAARHILDRPEDVAICSMRAFASQIDVPASTMVRLARALGFDSYESFRAPFEQSMRQRGETFSDRAQWLQHLASDNATGRIISDVASAAIKNLEASFVRIKPEAFEKAVKILLSSETIYVTGVGAMQHISGFFYSLARMALPNVVWAEPVGSSSFDDLSDISERDALFCCAFNPSATASVRTVKYVRKRGAKVVVITGSPVSPVVQGAAAALIVPTESPQFFPSQTAVMAVIETLIAILVANAGSQAVSRIEKIVNYRNEQGLYWQTRDNQ